MKHSGLPPAAPLLHTPHNTQPAGPHCNPSCIVFPAQAGCWLDSTTDQTCATLLAHTPHPAPALPTLPAPATRNAHRFTKPPATKCVDSRQACQHLHKCSLPTQGDDRWVPHPSARSRNPASTNRSNGLAAWASHHTKLPTLHKQRGGNMCQLHLPTQKLVRCLGG